MTQVAATPEVEDGWTAGLRLLALSISISVLAIIVPVGMLFTVPDVGRSQAWVITVVIAVWGGVRLSVLWVNGKPRLFDFFFWLYTYLFMGVAASVQIRTNNIAYTTPGMSPSLDMPTAWVVLLGVACYEVGRGVWLLLSRRAPEHELRPTTVSSPRATVLYVVGVLFSVYFLAKVGVRVIWLSRDSADQLLTNAWGDPATRAIVSALSVYPILVATGAIAEVRRRIPVGGSGRFVRGLMVFGGMLILAAVASPISSARYTFGTVAFAILVFAGGTRTRVRARLAMGGMIVAMIFLFPIADAFRRDVVDLDPRTGFFGEYAGSADYDSFWQIANALSYSVSDSMQPFRQILGSLLFWVPRSLWPDKPTDTGILLAQFRGYSFSNLSAPLWAELLVNGGVIAVGVGFAVLGPVLTAMDRRVVPAHYSGGWWGLLGAILPVYMMILMRGSLLQATGAVFVALGCLFWVRKAAPPDSVQSTALRSPPY